MFTTVVGVLFLLCGIGCVYTLGALVCLARYARRAGAGLAGGSSVTVLKPLYGDEPNLFNNLASFIQQDYQGSVHVVLGVSRDDDPAAAVARALQTSFPSAHITLVVDPRRHGRNGKVSNLINMSGAIAGDVVILADSDMVVERDYVATLVAALGQPGVGGVTCLYRGVSLPGLWSRLATGWVDGQFLPNVILGLTLGLAKPCMGSTIVLRRATLDAIGGFEAFKDHLADDYEIGAAIRRLGLSVVVPPRPVLGHTSSATTLTALLRQELRWAKTIRTVDPLGFAGSFVTHVLPFALLTAFVDGFHVRDWLLLAIVVGLRCALLIQVARFVRKDTADLSLLPIRDLLSFAVFLGSFLPGSIDWRGTRFGVSRDGILEAPDSTGR